MNYELYHHGIKGMKWGVRRFQNADGSLKPAGAKRYTDGNRESLGAKASKFVKKRKENLKNYSNYKKLQKDAREKYNLEGIEYKKQWEDWSNDEIKKTILGDHADSFKDWKPAGDKASKEYEAASKKAERYVNRKFAKEYGNEKLEQAKKTESYIVGAELVAALGIGAASMALSYKKG